MALDVKVVSRWAVPLAFVQYPNPEPFCAQLSNVISSRMTQGELHKNKTYRDTQSGIFESTFDLHKWPEEPIQRLFQFIHGSLCGIIQQLTGAANEELSTLRFQYHSWFHVTQSGGHQAGHSHPMAAWSGIFCVDPGEDVPGDAYQGTVRFHDPRAGANMYVDPSNEALIETYRFAAVTHRHRPGLLVIFPSYLFHEVVPYRGHRPRVVIAFNAWARPAAV